MKNLIISSMFLFLSFAANATNNYASNKSLIVDIEKFNKPIKDKGAISLSINPYASLINYETPDLLKHEKLTLKQNIGFGGFAISLLNSIATGVTARTTSQLLVGKKNTRFEVDLALNFFWEDGESLDLIIPGILVGGRHDFKENKVFLKLGAGFPDIAQFTFGRNF